MTKKLVKVRVLAGYGPLAESGHQPGDCVLLEETVAVALVATGACELVPEPERKKTEPDRPEQRPAPTAGVEKR